MRRWLYLLPFLLSLLATSAWAAITEVASQRATATECLATDTCAVAFPNNVTGGNLLVGGGNSDDTVGSHTFGVTDSVGTSYSTIVCTPDLNGSRMTAFLFYGIAGGSGANTVTVNPLLDSSVAQIVFAIDEFTGNHATPLDVNGGSSTGTSTAPADSLTTLAANDLVLGVTGFYTSQAVTPGGSYTQIGEDQSAADGFNLEFQIVTTAQAYSVDWTTGGSNEWHACTAAFKEAVAAAGSGSLRRRLP